jgi:putative addiction module component (TIGR02574 family)
MPSSPLTELLKLPPGDRAELAMALWESLSDAERQGAFELSDADRAELDRRWAERRIRPRPSRGPRCAPSRKAERWRWKLSSEENPLRWASGCTGRPRRVHASRYARDAILLSASGRRRTGCTHFVPALGLSVVSRRLSASSSRNHSRIRRSWQTDARRLHESAWEQIQLSLGAIESGQGAVIDEYTRFVEPYTHAHQHRHRRRLDAPSDAPQRRADEASGR